MYTAAGCSDHESYIQFHCLQILLLTHLQASYLLLITGLTVFNRSRPHTQADTSQSSPMRFTQRYTKDAAHHAKPAGSTKPPTTFAHPSVVSDQRPAAAPPKLDNRERSPKPVTTTASAHVPARPRGSWWADGRASSAPGRELMLEETSSRFISRCVLIFVGHPRLEYARVVWSLEGTASVMSFSFLGWWSLVRVTHAAHRGLGVSAITRTRGEPATLKPVQLCFLFYREPDVCC